MSDDKNYERLLNIYKFLTEDNQKFVKQAALEVIGYFTFFLPKHHLKTEFILEFYIKSINAYYNTRDINSQTDIEVFYMCAFNFPALLTYFGNSYWEDLKVVYMKLVRDKYSKVRRSLASSINEIASIIGEEETQKVLVPVFDMFYKEEGETQKAIYKSMPKFLSYIQPNKRIPYLDKLKRLINSKEKWRNKIECVELLGNLGGVFDSKTAYEQIFPICMKFMIDEVAEVRNHASKSIKSLIVQFLNNEEYCNQVLEFIESFAYSLKYIYRLLFINICIELCEENPELINKYFLESIKNLAFDKIINVQIQIVKLLVKMKNCCKYDSDLFYLALKRMYSIKNKQVQDELKKIKNMEFDIDEINKISQIEFSNTLFDNRMQCLKKINCIVIIPGININSKNKFSDFDVKSHSKTNTLKDSKKEKDSDKKEDYISMLNNINFMNNNSQNNSQTITNNLDHSKNEQIINKEELNNNNNTEKLGINENKELIEVKYDPIKENVEVNNNAINEQISDVIDNSSQNDNTNVKDHIEKSNEDNQDIQDNQEGKQSTEENTVLEQTDQQIQIEDKKENIDEGSSTNIEIENDVSKD